MPNKESSRGKNTVLAHPIEGESQAQANARLLLNPTVTSACVVKGFCMDQQSEIDLADLITALTVETKRSVDGDVERAKVMLTAQAHALDAIFCKLASKAASNAGEYLGAMEIYLKLALKAQAQSKATWEALMTLSNSNATSELAKLKAGKSLPSVISRVIVHKSDVENLPNELLEQENGEWLDSGTKVAAIDSHSALATLDPVHWTTNG